MGIKEFFRLTWIKVILFIILLIFIFFARIKTKLIDCGYHIPCDPIGIKESIFELMFNWFNIFESIIVSVFISYLISCFIIYSLNTLKVGLK